MANDFKIDARNFLASLSDYEKTVAEQVQQQIMKCALAIERDAKKNLTDSGAVDSGRLRMSVTTDVEAVKGWSASIEADLTKVPPKKLRKERNGRKPKGVSTNVEYAQYIEYGTYKMAARPFFRPSVEKNTARFCKNVAKILEGK